MLTLIVIRLGEIEYNVDKTNEAFDVLRFLNAIMYPHKCDFMDTISDYIDFSQNEELRQEVAQLRTYGQCVVEDCIMEGLSKGLAQGREQGFKESIQTLIETFQELNVPKEVIIEKLVLKFNLSCDEANKYVEQHSK